MLKDPALQEFMTTKEEVHAALIELAPPLEESMKWRIFDNELTEFSRLTNWLVDRLVVDKTEDPDPLPFYINTKENRKSRDLVRKNAEKHTDDLRKRSSQQ